VAWYFRQIAAVFFVVAVLAFVVFGVMWVREMRRGKR